MNIEEQLKKRVEELVHEVGFGLIMKVLMECSPPRNPLERVEMIAVLADSLAAAMVWEANWHVEDHGGYDCARRLFDEFPAHFRPILDEQFCKLLETGGKMTPPKSVNEQTYESILKEMKNNG